MARSNEYKSDGGSFDKLSDALHSIDELLEDVKRADEKREVLPQKHRGFRNVISELQNELGVCIAELMKNWNELDLDPLYIYSTEKVSVKQYIRNIKFLHPEYEHVWLTEGQGKNVASELIPFIDYGMVYDYNKQKLSVSNLLLDTKLNLPDFKTSLQAAHVDLEILKEDAKRVEMVCTNGEAAHKKLSEMLTQYCNTHEIELEINEETIPFSESKEERATRLKKEEDAARKAALEAKQKAEEEARAAQKKAEEEQQNRKREEARAVKEARAKEAQDRNAGRDRKTSQEREKNSSSSVKVNSGGSYFSSVPPFPSSTSGRVNAPPIPPPLKKSSV